MPTSEESQYVEMDGEELPMRMQRGHPLRVSDYEPVRIRDRITGREEFVTTEESHPLSPSRSTTSSLHRGENSEGKLKMADLIPSPHPQAAGNDYDVIPNRGFQSHENSPPTESGVPNLPPPRSSDAEVLRNEGFSETSEKSRAYSVSDNPMYITSAVGKKAKKVLNVNGDAESMRNPHFVEYDVPKDGVRPKPKPGTAVVVPGPGHPPQNANLSAWSGAGSKGVDVPVSATYDVPPNNTPAHSIVTSAQRTGGGVSSSSEEKEQVVYDQPPSEEEQATRDGSDPSSPKKMTSNPSYFAYDIPTHNPNESSSNERGTANDPSSSSGGAGASDRPVTTTSATYDVPRSVAQNGDHPLPVHAAEKEAVKALSAPNNNEVQSGDHPLPHQQRANFVMIEILPHTQDKQEVKEPMSHPPLVAYDIPLHPPKKIEVDTKDGLSTNSAFYKYDIPPSNMPAPKLDT